MAMKIKKTQLRDCAQAVLRGEWGYEVAIKPGRGIIPGARLLIRKGSEPLRVVAVRTSFDREIGLTRDPDGNWKTIPNVDEVVVVAPSADDVKSAEVFWFDAGAIASAFDAARVAHQGVRYSLPIFLPLDDRRNSRSGKVKLGLKHKAKRVALIPLSEVTSLRRPPEESFIERVKREFAQLNGVDVSKVAVEFRIIA
jgi:hypothetical protein